MNSFFEGQPCFFQPKQGSFGLEAYIYIICRHSCIYIYSCMNVHVKLFVVYLQDLL